MGSEPVESNARRAGAGERVLITGGAGFIGSYLADELLRAGYRVRALDNLTPQIHGPERGRPAYLDDDVELQVGDVRDRDAVNRALAGVDAVFHLAARVGVGQSMYDVAEYTSVNSLGTSVLLEGIVESSVSKLVLASSMSVYGEGEYRMTGGKPGAASPRTAEQLHRREWEPRSIGGEELVPVPTSETKLPEVSSVYALTKFQQERLCLLVGAARGIPAVALRLFNTYGPRQALSNPYTGVLAIFTSRLLNGRPPLVYEDGLQRRDFVSVHDVARACRLALEGEQGNGEVLNVGSGTSVRVGDVARRLATVLGVEIEPEITGLARSGDIRHCFADIGRARALLGFEPAVQLEPGLEELAEWLQEQVAEDRFELAASELAERGLTW